ncbi:hypothetical protein A4A49_39314 [Nicotiana attenuata]|uniref:CCHC-type domain-containing protein n=1 Tax=Nicotiana attenuata TaxID=49451 RepID=A0A314KTS4_NICAT|nr:hypothetical protein A4A49_39314 [Nicotiana attenuata]
MAKIRVEVDLLKPLSQSVFVGQEYEDSPLKDYTQKLEYEGVPKYCKHCRKIGHYMVNCRALEKKKVENKEEEEVQNQDNDPQLSTGQEGSIPANNSNEEVQKLLNSKSTQNQQIEDDKLKIKKDSRKKTKQKKTRKMPKKKSKVLFKPANSKRRDKSDSAAKQNDFSEQSIEESILSPATKDKTFQKDQSEENNNNETISEANELDLGNDQQMQTGLRQASQENGIEGIEKLDQCYESSSSTVPTEIRNQPGLQLVVDLYENKEDCNITNLENDSSDSFQEAEQLSNQQELRKEDQDSHIHTDDQQQNTRRGRSETRKSGKRHKNKTQPSVRRNQKENNPPNCLND